MSRIYSMVYSMVCSRVYSMIYTMIHSITYNIIHPRGAEIWPMGTCDFYFLCVDKRTYVVANSPPLQSGRNYHIN